MYLVSACLCGFPCRYNAKPLHDSRIVSLKSEGLVVPVCPEMLGGLPAPRAPGEIIGGTGADVLARQAKVLTPEGFDLSPSFILGAQRALMIGLQTGCTSAILKARSPACGFDAIYDGTFSHVIREGDGVFAALLRRYGFTVYTEEEDWPTEGLSLQ